MKVIFSKKAEELKQNSPEENTHLTGMALFKARIRSFLNSEKVRNQLYKVSKEEIDTVIQENDDASRIFTGELHEPDKLTEASILRKKLSKKELEDLISPDVHSIIKNAMEGYVRGLKS
jgi:hypothetical protein